MWLVGCADSTGPPDSSAVLRIDIAPEGIIVAGETMNRVQLEAELNRLKERGGRVWLDWDPDDLSGDA